MTKYTWKNLMIEDRGQWKAVICGLYPVKEGFHDDAVIFMSLSEGPSGEFLNVYKRLHGYTHPRLKWYFIIINVFPYYNPSGTLV